MDALAVCLAQFCWNHLGKLRDGGKHGPDFSDSVLFQGRILSEGIVKVIASIPLKEQPIDSDSCLRQDDSLWWCWARGIWGPFLGVAHWFDWERLPSDRWCLSPQRMPGWTELPFSQRGCVTSVRLPQGAVAMAFPCSWTHSCCSFESWQLPEKAEQALWLWSEGRRCFTSRSAADSLGEFIIFFL